MNMQNLLLPKTRTAKFTCKDHLFLLPFFLLFLLVQSAQGDVRPVLTIRQGAVRALTLATIGAPPVGRFQNQEIPFFETSSDMKTPGDAPQPEHPVTALIGMDMEQSEGTYPLEIYLNKNEKTEPLRYTISVLPANFELQTLTLPKDKVDLDSKTLERVQREAAQMRNIFNQPSGSPLWQGSFLEPVHGEISGQFGLRRVINGEKKNPHTGVDIAAPMGEPVLAPNQGRVVLTGSFFFNGQSVVIDHGGGIVTMYFHLSEIVVKEGASVKKGEIIGRVGASGRATGPHLHWGARLHGARVDPFLLIKAITPLSETPEHSSKALPKSLDSPTFRP